MRLNMRSFNDEDDHDQVKEEEESDEEDSDSSLLSDESDDFDTDEDEEDDKEKKNEKEEDEEEDELIKALRKSKEKPDRKAPPDIRLATEASDISFHPENNLIAVSAMDGSISIFNYGNDKNTLSKKLLIHKKNVRSLEYNDTGSMLFTASKDKSIKVVDAETYQVRHKVPRAHGDSALYRIKPLDDFLCASGDEDGTVKLWDSRQNKCVMSEKRFDEFVSDIFIDEEKKIMVASSGEGTIQSFNIRGKRLGIQSEVYPGQMNCMSSVRSGSKLTVGCDDGTLYMFKWGQFGYHDDKYPGHPDAINALLSVTNNVVLTGCEDGTIRAVHLYPHRFLGVVGNHDSDFPVEKLDVSSEGELIASVSHDQKVKFWNIKYLEECDYSKTKKPYKHPGKIKVKRKENKMLLAREVEHQLPSSNRNNKKDFFNDL